MPAVHLVTGAAGFIGSKVCDMLLEEGHPVIGIDNLNDAYDVRLKHWRLERLHRHPAFAFYMLDICDNEALKDLFETFHENKRLPVAVLNLAARAGVRTSVANPWVYLETNTNGTLNLLELCRQYEISKFVLASSSSLYGKHNPIPFTENANTDRPASPYAASKKAAEVLCAVYHDLYELDVTIFRYFTVYGPAGRPDMSPFRFTQWIYEGRPLTIFGDGQQSRDFTYIDDIARGTIAGLRPLGYEVINLGSSRPVVLMDMVQMIEALSGKRAQFDYQPSHPVDLQSTWASIEKAQMLLDWRPQVTIEEGLEELVDWYQENRNWAREIRT